MLLMFIPAPKITPNVLRIVGMTRVGCFLSRMLLGKPRPAHVSAVAPPPIISSGTKLDIDVADLLGRPAANLDTPELQRFTVEGKECGKALAPVPLPFVETSWSTGFAFWHEAWIRDVTIKGRLDLRAGGR